jgi:ketosteroid isomerase-like protein
MQPAVGSDDHEAAAEIARGFADAWARPDVERFVALLASDVRLLQPVTPPIVGREAAREEFTRLLRWLPDVRGTVDEWSACGDTLLIAWRMRFTLGRSPVEVRMVDRIVARDGSIVEREAYFDSLRLVLAIVARPSAWPGYLRYRGWLR